MKKYRVIKKGDFYYPQWNLLWFFWMSFKYQEQCGDDDHITRCCREFKEAEQYIINDIEQIKRYKKDSYKIIITEYRFNPKTNITSQS